MNQSEKSTQIAIGGVFSALCLVIMFLTGLIPFASYAMPAIAGAMLMIVVIENGNKVAMMVYVSVSLLSLFIVPDLEAKILFIALFGYYPIVKGKLEKLPSKILQWLCKLTLFFVTVTAGFTLSIKLFGLVDFFDEFGDWGQYGALALLIASSFVFILYDITLSKYTEIYIYRFRGKLGRT